MQPDLLLGATLKTSRQAHGGPTPIVVQMQRRAPMQHGAPAPGLSKQAKSTPAVQSLNELAHEKASRRIPGRIHHGPGPVRRGNLPVAPRPDAAARLVTAGPGPLCRGRRQSAQGRGVAFPCTSASSARTAPPGPGMHGSPTNEPRKSGVANGFSWSTKRHCGRTRTIASSSGGAPSLPSISSVLTSATRALQCPVAWSLLPTGSSSAAWLSAVPRPSGTVQTTRPSAISSRRITRRRSASRVRSTRVRFEAARWRPRMRWAGCERAGRGWHGPALECRDDPAKFNR